MKKLKLLTLVCGAALLASCVTSPVAVTSSTTPLHDKIIDERLGRTSGNSSAYSVLGLWMIGRPDIGTALNQALESKEADALIEVVCYEQYAWFLLFSRTRVSVEGEAVRFRETGEKK